MNSKKINKRILIIFNIVILLVGTFLDRFSKYLAQNELKNHPSVSLINGILDLTYLENTGAAFGILKNQKSFFIMIAIIVIWACLYVIIKTPGKKKYIWANIFLSFIITGALGNLLDRILYGYVVDFIYFSVINFPVFNVADIFVTVSTLVLAFLILFYYKEDDLNFLKFNEKRIRDVEK